MATAIHKICSSFLLFVLLISPVIDELEARPLSVIIEKHRAGEDMMFDNLFDWLALGSVKESGPSQGGEGHSFTTRETLGGIKDSGPSPGEGHKVIADKATLGGIKNSGPSPGQGHRSIEKETFAGDKVKKLETLGGIKDDDSGPSPGQGH